MGDCEDWSTGIVVPLWIHKGDKTDKNTYRGITLLSVGSKILARVVAQRAKHGSQGANSNNYMIRLRHSHSGLMVSHVLLQIIGQKFRQDNAPQRIFTDRVGDVKGKGKGKGQGRGRGAKGRGRQNNRDRSTCSQGKAQGKNNKGKGGGKGGKGGKGKGKGKPEAGEDTKSMRMPKP